MKRKVRVLHLDDAGFVPVFEWETKKKGFGRDVIEYIISKFKDEELYPSGYTGRSLQAGDRLELTILDGDYTGRMTTYEMVDSLSYREI